MEDMEVSFILYSIANYFDLKKKIASPIRLALSFDHLICIIFFAEYILTAEMNTLDTNIEFGNFPFIAGYPGFGSGFGNGFGSGFGNGFGSSYGGKFTCFIFIRLNDRIDNFIIFDIH